MVLTKEEKFYDTIMKSILASWATKHALLSTLIFILFIILGILVEAYLNDMIYFEILYHALVLTYSLYSAYLGFKLYMLTGHICALRSNAYEQKSHILFIISILFTLNLLIYSLNEEGDSDKLTISVINTAILNISMLILFYNNIKYIEYAIIPIFLLVALRLLCFRKIPIIYYSVLLVVPSFTMVMFYFFFKRI